MQIVNGLETLWSWVAKTSWQAAVLVILVLVAQRLLGKRLSPAWRHGLWYVVLIRLLLPISIQSPISVFNLTTAAAWQPVSKGIAEPLRLRRRETAEPVSTSPGPAPGTAATAAPAAGVATAAASGTAKPNAAGGGATRKGEPAFAWSLKWVTLLVWLCGVLVLGLHFLGVHRRFAKHLRDARVVQDAVVRRVLTEAATTVRYRGRAQVRETAAVSAPALFGLFRHRLLLPQGMLETFSPAELRWVFLHELAHLKRGDLLVNWLMNVFVVLHWFNPLVWCAFYRGRNDCEEACDAAALRAVDGGERRAYGEAMVKLVERISLPTSAPGLLGILETKSQMERRINLIATFKKTNRWPVVAVASLAGLAVFALTDAQTSTDSAQATATQAGVGNARIAALFKPVATIAGANDEITSSDRLRLSPNGKFLNWQGRVVPLDGSSPFSLTDRRVWDESWAPNGERIACCGADGLYIVPVSAETGHATGPAKRLINGRLKLWADHPLDWTPDSTRVVFVAWDQDYTSPVAKAVAANSGDVVDAPDWAELGLRSPDGKMIAYSPRGDGIWARPAAGGPAKNLSAAEESRWCEPLAWSADGQWVISQVGPADSDQELRLIRLADGQDFRIPIPVSAGRFVGKSAGGDQIYFYRTSYDQAFVPKVMSVKGGLPVSLARRNRGLSLPSGSQLFVTAQWANGMPYSYQWLPDGQRLVVTTVKVEGQATTAGRVLFSFTGADPVELKLDLPKIIDEEDALLSPDGSQLLLLSSADGSPAWYLLSLSLPDGRTAGRPVKLCDGGNQLAAWSPDGKHLAIVRDNEIWTVSNTGRNWKQLTHTSVPKRAVAWSPDGTLLAYHTYEPGKTELWVVPASGGQAESIYVSPHQPMWVWSPDSHSITIPENGVIMQYSVAEKTVQTVLKLADLGFSGLGWLAWSPDGSGLALQATGSPTEQDTLVVWTTRDGKSRKLDAQSPVGSQADFTWSPDSQCLAYTSVQQPKTRLEGVLSRLDVGEALELAANGALPRSSVARSTVTIPIARPTAVPLTGSRFIDNFDAGLSPIWRTWEAPAKGVPREHAVKNGELVLENSRAILGEPDWTNYVVRVRIYLESTPARGDGLAGISVRLTRDNPDNPSSFNWYAFSLECFDGRPNAVYMGILYHDSSGQYHTGSLAVRRHPLALKQWYTLEFEVKGQRLRGYLDGQLVAEATDDRLSQGGVKLSSHRTRVRFDDFSVQLLP